MGRLISDHILVVFFVYGLAFFLLGIAILLQPRQESAFNIGNSLWLLAGFGLLHGLGEWMDMFLTLGDTYWTPLGTEVIKIASFYFGAASFVCLLQFSLRIIFQNRSKYEFLELTALIASLLFLVAVTSYGISTGFSSQWLLLSQILMRYLLGVPGAILTAIGFWRQRKFSDIQGLSSYGWIRGDGSNPAPRRTIKAHTDHCDDGQRDGGRTGEMLGGRDERLCF
jgi:hypothetical protein